MDIASFHLKVVRCFEKKNKKRIEIMT